jgi:predicted transposase/invertase (TIGR01784 family)
MARYLDPKNDLTFKRIFGEHPHLLISFLNALMPLAPDRMIEHIEYLSPEQVPDSPLKKNSIVDVKCTDQQGRQFIVEMQMYWSDAFKSRLVFNTSKAYVRQLNKSEIYRLLQPVYGLGIINESFDLKTDKFYHHYQTVNRENTEEIIEGLEFVLIELPKFKPASWLDKKMAVLWLRFLTEIEEKTKVAPAELLDNAEIQEAITLCEEGAFSEEELAIYDQYWDSVRTEKSVIVDAEMKGEAKGRAEGLEKGRAEELEKIVLTAYQNKFSTEQIQTFSNLSKDDILEILKRNKVALT